MWVWRDSDVYSGKGDREEKKKNNMIDQTKKAEIINEYKTKDGDTGSAEVQVAILTELRDLLICRR